MEFDKLAGKSKKGLITKTWERCTSFGSFGRKKNYTSENQHSLGIKSNSWTEGIRIGTGKKFRVVPEGYFSVYVGSEMQRFVIRTKYLNHPLFRMLLEEAESEFGYSSEGPLVLPCDVDLFKKLLMEMDDCDEPLFRMLLEEAESEFGYSSEGPLVLPCDVDLFKKLLMEMDDCDELDHHRHHGCSFVAKNHGSYRLLSPTTSAFNKFSF